MVGGTTHTSNVLEGIVRIRADVAGVKKKLDEVTQRTKKLESQEKRLNSTIQKLNKTSKERARGIQNVSKQYVSQVKRVQGIEKQLKSLHALQRRGITLDTASTRKLKSLQMRYARMGGSVKNLTSSHTNLLARFTKFRWALVNVALAAGVVAGSYRILIRPAIEMETAMAGVRKTTGFTAGEISNLRSKLIDMSRSLPVTALELAKIAAVAGQLGLGQQGANAIEEFTRTAAQMAIATELSAEDAAKALAKISQAFNIPIISASRLGSVINELSNTTAATSTEIVASLVKVGAAAANLGLEADTMAAFGATLISSGMRAERAGTRLKTALNRMTSNMQDFADVIPNMDVKEFASLLETDVEAALFLVIESLKNYGNEQQVAQKSTELFGRVGGFAIQTLIGSYDKLLDNVKTANDEFERGLSLIKETSIQTNTAAGQWELLSNSIKAATLEERGFVTEFLSNLRSMKKFGTGAVLFDEFFPSTGGTPATGIRKALDALGFESNIITTLNSDLQNLTDTARKAGVANEVFDEMIQIIKDAPNRATASDAIERIFQVITTQSTEAVEKVRLLNEEVGDTNPAYNAIIGVVSQASKELENQVFVTVKTRDNLELLHESLLKLRDISTTRIIFLDDLITALSSLRGEGVLGVQDFIGAFQQLFRGTLTQFDIMRNKIETFFSGLDSAELDAFNQETGETERSMMAWVSAQEQVITVQEEHNIVLDAFNRKIGLIRAEISDWSNSLRSLKSDLSDVNKSISELSKPRFTGQLDIDILINKADLYLKKLNLTEAGVTDAQAFLQEMLAKSANGYDELFDSIESVNNIVDSGKDSYDAWRETVSEFIRETVKSGNDLGKNVSTAVKKYQTLLLSTSKFGDEQDRQEDLISLLRDAYDVHYGAMTDDVNFAVQAHEEAGRVIFSTSEGVIASLRAQWERQTELTAAVQRHEDRVLELKEALSDTKAARDEYNDWVKGLTDSFEDLEETIASAIARMREAQSINSSSGGGGSSTRNFSSNTGRNISVTDSSTASPGSYKVTKASGETVYRTHKFNDFIFRPGQQPVAFDKNDTVVGFKGGAGGSMGQVAIENINISGVSGDPQEFAYEFAKELRRELKTL